MTLGLDFRGGLTKRFWRPPHLSCNMAAFPTLLSSRRRRPPPWNRGEEEEEEEEKEEFKERETLLYALYSLRGV